MRRYNLLRITARSLAMMTVLLVSSAAFLSARDSLFVPNALSVRIEGLAQDSATALATVTRFHEALAAGDSATALTLLSDDVVILESGGVETRDDYRAHHLPADIEFARAVPSKPGKLQVRVRGDVAWVSGTSATQGEFRGRPINSAGAELVVLTREAKGWMIRAIHWSSRARRS